MQSGEHLNTRASYAVIVDGEYRQQTLRDLVCTISAQTLRPRAWSARLSTGLFGLPDCTSGNRGPKNMQEVLLAVGDKGLQELITLGFLTCPTCTPEQVDGFWDTADLVIHMLYGLQNTHDFTNRQIFPFDARRVSWEKVVPAIGGFPDRLYIPEGVEEDELNTLGQRLSRLTTPLPDIGFYDRTVPERFTRYILPDTKEI